MAKFTVSGTKTKVIFEYEALTAKVVAVIGDVAENLWVKETNKDGVVTNPFADATNQEKLDVVDAHVKSVIVDMANSFDSNKRQRVERDKAAKHTI